MSNYVIFTDSACDIGSSLLKEWNVESVEMNFRFENEDKEYSNSEMAISTFYGRMKDGDIAKTAAVNPEKFLAAFEEVLKNGTDILYLGFSSGLSTTYNSAKIAAEDLLSKYLERKLITVDTLAASSGQGLLVYLASQKKSEGASMEEVADYIESIKLKLCHWFTVEDLVYLKRGGRVSPTVAFVGTLLGIKPILHVDNAGKLINVSKARGRKASLNAIIDKYGELAEDKANGTVFISNAGCFEDAVYLKNAVKEKYGAEVKVISDIGPVIGAHSGPGTVALFFIGKER